MAEQLDATVGDDKERNVGLWWPRFWSHSKRWQVAPCLRDARNPRIVRGGIEGGSISQAADI